MINLDFKGKKAVVTGASKGIGAAVVKMLADQGADVSFCARNQKGVEELTAYKAEGKLGTVKGFIADMGKEISTNKFIEKITDQHTRHRLAMRVYQTRKKSVAGVPKNAK